MFLEIECEGVGWIYLARDRDPWWVLMKTVTIHLVVWKAGNSAEKEEENFPKVRTKEDVVNNILTTLSLSLLLLYYYI
jgi:hypothetical protein